MNAFVIIHFGNNIKYLELELYFLIMLQKNTINDIIYMYSKNDTPDIFVNAIEKINVKTISYDDNNITYNIKNFKSTYVSFNTLRTCNFIFAYTLTKYDKICILESDMVVMENIDDIFQLKIPSILYYNKDIKKNNYNYLIDISKDKVIDICNNHSSFNGGVLLFKPSITIYKKFINNIKLIIEKECKYPNETLFTYTLNKIYNLPIKYNYSHYYLDKQKLYGKIIIYHFNNTTYKPIDIIKDNYLEKEKKDKKKIIIFFKKNVYDKYSKLINNILNFFSVNH